VCSSANHERNYRVLLNDRNSTTSLARTILPTLPGSREFADLLTHNQDTKACFQARLLRLVCVCVAKREREREREKAREKARETERMRARQGGREGWKEGERYWLVGFT
jgi:hypothetical protein